MTRAQARLVVRSALVCAEANALWMEALTATASWWPVRAEILEELRRHRRRCDLCCMLEVMES